MDLLHYLRVLWRRRFVFLLTLVVTLIVVTVGTLLLTPVYQTSALVRISATTGGSLNYYDAIYLDRLFSTFLEIASSESLNHELQSVLGIDTMPTITIENIPNTELFEISVESQSPSTAAAAANALAELLIKNSKSIYMGDTKTAEDIIQEQLAQAKLDLENVVAQYEGELLSLDPDENAKAEITGITVDEKRTNYQNLLEEYHNATFRESIIENSITIVQTAQIPTEPISPKLLVNIVLGVLVGMVGGAGLAFVIENTDSTLTSDEQIVTTTQVPVFAKIPSSNKRNLIVEPNRPSQMYNIFEKIAKNLLYVSESDRLKSFLFVSTQSGEGKTTVVANLGIVLAKLGKKVLLVDGDMNEPSLHRVFGVSPEVGLVDYLNRETDFNQITLLDVGIENLYLLPGKQNSSVNDLTFEKKMQNLLKEAEEKFDFVLIDSSPMFPLIHIAMFVGAVEGVILVIRRTFSDKGDVVDASDYVSTLEDKFTGMIVNQAEKATNNFIFHKSS